ncbi:MAG: hypothetical protein COT88_01980 [Candidatus Colwellbacteria bacterium CG10_big_fil_rev_8_21_14_0_10_41_28]|uniref:HMA domain-containing protein n=1 Tax=Candidatus Colwellbacteria bacterium CG10_big_fil_rev_8_21_14_0_10_41_28 TaxID=1974539 RepID=A0A2H0VH07_9BACT|nr:MAG: hypothetical protein COT88_01980 [Candidatus Colwellbacteria bacterium CG10_big_fil_rev_8_21_14_0_10_41_28]
MTKRMLILIAITLVISSCADSQGSTTTTTVAPTTTTSSTTTTVAPTTTTTTEPLITGILVLAPETCEGCDDLVSRLEELARGEIPIEVRTEGERPAVRILDADGSLVKEWVGVESTIHPNDRATAENAVEMVRVACSALRTCSPETTSTTTTIPSELVLKPNDFVCGMEVERRYTFDGSFPAPLGKIWEGHPDGASTVNLSGILVDYGEVTFDYDGQPVTWSYADFCFGEHYGEDAIFRFFINASKHRILTAINTSVSGELPFGPSFSNTDQTTYYMSEMSKEKLLEGLVIGRQYVFFVSTASTCVGWAGNEIECPFDSEAIARYLEGSGLVPTKPGQASFWYGIAGSV